MLRFRFTLSHPESGLTEEITEVDGWKDSVMKLDRHEEFHSLIEYFEGSFIFYGNNGIVNGGIETIKLLIRNYGLDTTILILIELTYDEVTFTEVFSGQLSIVDKEEMPNNKMRVPIIPDDRWAKFISRLNTPVNIRSSNDLDGNLISNEDRIRLKLTSQTVKYTTEAKMQSSWLIGEHDDSNTGDWFQIDWDDYTLDEVINKYSYPIAFNFDMPFEKFNVEYSGEYYIRARIYMTAVGYTLEGGGFFSFNDWLQVTFEGEFPFDSHIELYINEVLNETFTKTQLTAGDGSGYTRFDLETTLTLQAGDRISILGRVDDHAFAYFPVLLGSDTSQTGEQFDTYLPPGSTELTPDFPSGYTDDNELVVIALTTSPDTYSESFLLHDVGGYISDRIIGQQDTFISNLLGSEYTQYRQYESGGCAWKYALLKGLQARQYSLEEKPFFMSFDQWWKGVNPVLNLSLEFISSLEDSFIKIEEKAYQYDNSTGTSVDFYNVREITSKYDNDRIFNKASVGYVKWESEDISGLDDPQTKKTYATRFKKVGKGIELYSEFIGASLLIEKTRRTTKEKSADYKHDNDTFIIALNGEPQDESPELSPDLIMFIPELDENFVLVENLLSAETRYNLRITPARNFLRWQNYIQGALQSYTDSSFNFTSGEGNYDMTSEMIENDCLNEDYDGNVLDEKGNIPVTEDFLHLPDLYEATIPMEWEEFQIIRNNKRKPIGISLTDTDPVPMFIKSLSYKPVKGEADVIMWAKEFLDLSQVPDTTPMQECYPSAGECEDALTDELGEILTDELGVCITE